MRVGSLMSQLECKSKHIQAKQCSLRDSLHVIEAVLYNYLVTPSIADIILRMVLGPSQDHSIKVATHTAGWSKHRSQWRASFPRL